MEQKRTILMATMGLEIGGAETPIVELAKELGISYSACDKRIQRAKKKLREKLQEI